MLYIKKNQMNYMFKNCYFQKMQESLMDITISKDNLRQLFQKIFVLFFPVIMYVALSMHEISLFSE